VTHFYFPLSYTHNCLALISTTNEPVTVETECKKRDPAFGPDQKAYAMGPNAHDQKRD